MSDMRDEWRTELKRILEEGRAAFEGAYGKELERLESMSRVDVEGIVPDTTDLKAYDDLVAVVRRASAENFTQARLRASIESLGETAVHIAKSVGGLLV